MICCSCGKEIDINYGREYWNGIYCKKCADEMLSTPEDTKKYEKIIAGLQAENAELRKRLYDVEGRMERHMLALKSVCEKYVVAANINTITDENGKSWVADKEICAIDLMANELKKIDDNIGRYKK